MTPLTKALVALTIGSWSATALALSFADVPANKVTLYAGSAKIERQVPVAANQQRLVIEQMPANFDVNTLRINSTNGVSVGQIIVDELSEQQSQGSAQRALDEQIQGVLDKISAIDIKIQAAELQTRYLDRLGQGQANTPTQASNQAVYLSALDALATARQARIDKRQLEVQLANLNADKARQAENYSGRRTLTIMLNAPSSGQLSISYQVNGAGWNTHYRAALDSQTSQITLSRQAQISQKTGEDWRQVQMILSTGQPLLSPDATMPYTWTVSYAEHNQRKVMSKTARMAAAPMMMEAAVASDAVAAYAPPVQQVNGNFSTEFIVPSRVNVDSDGKEVTVNLTQTQLAATMSIQTTPRLDKAAYITARTQRPDGVWLSGPIGLYRDGDYVGQSYWQAENSDFAFSFGRDDLMKVEVINRANKLEQGGVFSGRKVKVMQDTYRITNLHSNSIPLLLLESTPQSASGELDVETNFSIAPSQANWQDIRGVNAWQQTLASKAVLELQVDYKISYPEKGYVVGLP